VHKMITGMSGPGPVPHIILSFRESIFGPEILCSYRPPQRTARGSTCVNSNNNNNSNNNCLLSVCLSVRLSVTLCIVVLRVGRCRGLMCRLQRNTEPPKISASAISMGSVVT